MINPAKTCQPIGAMYAALGIHGCLPHSHGSQGCCAYHRSTLTRHYKEPISAATSSFTEGASVFGGQANLLQAIDNIFTVYEPEVIAVHTTCLSETIGDDLQQIATRRTTEGKIPEGKTRDRRPNTRAMSAPMSPVFPTWSRPWRDWPSPRARRTARSTSSPAGSSPRDMEEIKRLAEHDRCRLSPSFRIPPAC